jgi:hypothetical protein
VLFRYPRSRTAAVDDAIALLVGSDVRVYPMGGAVTLYRRVHVSVDHAREVERREPRRRARGRCPAMAGAALQISKARLACEYNLSKVNSFSMKVGIGR